MAERVLDDAADPVETGERWWSGGSRPATSSPTLSPDDDAEPSGYSTVRRRGLLAVAVMSGIVIVGAGIVIGVLVAGRTPPLELEVVDASGENPLPDDLRMTVNGDPVTPRFSGDTAALVVDDAFDDQGDASVVLHVPERVEVTIGRGLVGDEPVEVLIVDDAVLVGGGKHERVNPVQDAREAKAEADREAERQRIAAQTLERERVDGELDAVDAQLVAARSRFDAIWTDRDTAPYAEIAAVVDGEILPVVDAVLGHLGALASSDQLSQEAVTAWAACVTATRAAYVRESFSDSTLTYEQNEAQQTDLWNASGAACSAAAAKQALIG